MQSWIQEEIENRENNRKKVFSLREIHYKMIISRNSNGIQTVTKMAELFLSFGSFYLPSATPENHLVPEAESRERDVLIISMWDEENNAGVGLDWR